MLVAHRVQCPHSVQGLHAPPPGSVLPVAVSSPPVRLTPGGSVITKPLGPVEMTPPALKVQYGQQQGANVKVCLQAGSRETSRALSSNHKPPPNSVCHVCMRTQHMHCGCTDLVHKSRPHSRLCCWYYHVVRPHETSTAPSSPAVVCSLPHMLTV